MKNTVLKKSVTIGVACVSFYLTSYLFRQLLSVFAPQMLASGGYDKTAIAALSSAYMLVYAVGNLLNGMAGDRIKPKYMVAVGLTLAAVALFFFPLAEVRLLRLLLYGLLGLGLSMLRGPLTKVISENLPKRHASVVCMFFTAASCLGPFLASLLLLLCPWQEAYALCGGLSLLAAGTAYFVFSALERKGKLTANLTAAKGSVSVLAVFRLKGFTLNLLSDMMLEVVTIAVVFWAPTYMVEHLQLSQETAGMVYSGITLAAALCPFGCLGCLKLFGGNTFAMMRGMFLLSAALFAGMLLPVGAVGKIILFLLAIMAVNVGCAIIWSVYLPSLGPTGLVSGANGVFDCMGYVSSALTNLLFAWVMGQFGWNGMIAVWILLALIGGGFTVLGSWKGKMT